MAVGRRKIFHQEILQPETWANDLGVLGQPPSTAPVLSSVTKFVCVTTLPNIYSRRRQTISAGNHSSILLQSPKTPKQILNRLASEIVYAVWCFMRGVTEALKLRAPREKATSKWQF